MRSSPASGTAARFRRASYLSHCWKPGFATYCLPAEMSRPRRTPDSSAVLLDCYHRLRTGIPYLGRRLELFEILGEALGQIGGHLVVSGLVFPRRTRIEQLRWHSWTRLRN